MMLGKTNVTTMAEGAMVTEIEDLKWIRMQSGINSNFVKAIYENGYLAAITTDGKVAYTTDGEAWQVSVLEYTDYQLEDIAWDGSRFLLAGSYKDTVERTDGTSGEYYLGFIATTADFVSYEYFGADTEKITSKEQFNYFSRYISIYPVNNNWVILAISRIKNGSGSGEVDTIEVIIGRAGEFLEKRVQVENQSVGNILVGKNSQGFLFTNVTQYNEYVCLFNGNTLTWKEVYKLRDDFGTVDLLPVFECKDELYYMTVTQDENYKFAKVLFSGEEMVLSTGINYGFVDGVYFNECKLFINNHEMMILKKGESIIDKTQENLIEIAPENTMTCITKAFGRLFAFGNQGLILKSSTEGNSEEAILIQTISAKKALLEANAYTDRYYKLLEARIAELEAGMTGKEE
ncbi:MAG: hypothetical protein NC123_16495 [Butyrivibrio sp.]|nr:hypothetical protein [Acetatifactor muris]MCM1561119.1 hypothetical protein [Butyrivibrio sp.]